MSESITTAGMQDIGKASGLVMLLHKRINIKLKSREEVNELRQMITFYVASFEAAHTLDIYNQTIAQDLLELAEKLRSRSFVQVPKTTLKLHMHQANALLAVCDNVPFMSSNAYAETLLSEIINQIDRQI